MSQAERLVDDRPAPASERAAWWAELKGAGGEQVDPIAWAPWAMLLREAQFGVGLDGRWMVHVPGMQLVTWPGHLALRSAMLNRYRVALERVQRAADDELARRRALRAMDRPKAVLGVLRAVEVMASLVPHRIAVQVPSAVPGRAADWRLGRLSGSEVPSAPER